MPGRGWPVSELLGAAERPETLSGIVLERIRGAIVNQELAAGARVTEAGLAQLLNVSKTPVREALYRLREIGLIESDARRGGRVVAPSRQAIVDAYGVREALECFAAETAAAAANAAGARLIQELARRSLAAARSGDLRGFRTADDELHRAVATCAGNERLATSIDQSLSLVSALRNRDAPEAALYVACGKDHVQVARAIREGEGERARAVMAQHIRRIRDVVVLTFEGSPSGDGTSSEAQPPA